MSVVAKSSMIDRYSCDQSYVQATWNLNEVLAKKDEIVRDNLLVTKLAGSPKSI